MGDKQDKVLCAEFSKKYAKQYSMDYKELMGAAWEGLLHARNTYDPSKGVRKEYYETLMISNYIRMYIKQVTRTSKYEIGFQDVAEKHYSYDLTDVTDRLMDVAKVLTERELEVISLLQEGNTQAEIAAILGVSQQAVSIRFNNIKKKVQSLETTT